MFLVPEDCPKCGHKESWSVWTAHEGYPMGMCHRAACGHVERFTSYIAPPKKKEPRYYTRPIVPLTAKQEEFLMGRYGFLPEVRGYNEVEDRFLLPVYGPAGHNHRGYVAYSFSSSPKSLTYNEKPEEPFIHYSAYDYGYVAGAVGLPAVIVEDWFSAEKVSAAGGRGVALMGTNLSQEAVAEIASVAGGPPTFLALDRDAYPKTLKYLARYREQFPRGLYAWSLRVDLKYEPIERIRAALVEGKVDFNNHDYRSTNLRSNAK